MNIPDIEGVVSLIMRWNAAGLAFRWHGKIAVVGDLKKTFGHIAGYVVDVAVVMIPGAGYNGTFFSN